MWRENVSTTTTQILIIRNWKPTSLNHLLRMDRFKANKAVQLDKAIVMAEAVSQINRGRLSPATGRRQVDVMFLGRRWQGLPDGDNGIKAMADGLVGCGLLLGDSFRHLRWGSIDGKTDPSVKMVDVWITLTDIPEVE